PFGGGRNQTVTFPCGAIPLAPPGCTRRRSRRARETELERGRVRFLKNEPDPFPRQAKRRKRMREHDPPGPRDRLFGVTSYLRFLKAPLAFTTDLVRTYGDIVLVRMGWIRVYFVNHPGLIREVLVTRAKSFRKLRRQMRVLARLEGESVNTAEGEVWRRHRPVVQTAFHARHFDRFARSFVEVTRRRVGRWSPGATFDVVEEMNQLALELIAKVLFNVDWSDRAARLREAVHVFRAAMQREVSRPFVLPDWLPLPDKLRQRRAVRDLDAVIWDLLRARRAAAAEEGDMLSLMLAAARAGANGPLLTDREIRDEVATLFVA